MCILLLTETNADRGSKLGTMDSFHPGRASDWFCQKGALAQSVGLPFLTMGVTLPDPQKHGCDGHGLQALSALWKTSESIEVGPWPGMRSPYRSTHRRLVWLYRDMRDTWDEAPLHGALLTVWEARVATLTSTNAPGAFVLPLPLNPEL